MKIQKMANNFQFENYKFKNKQKNVFFCFFRLVFKLKLILKM